VTDQFWICQLFATRSNNAYEARTTVIEAPQRFRGQHAGVTGYASGSGWYGRQPEGRTEATREAEEEGQAQTVREASGYWHLRVRDGSGCEEAEGGEETLMVAVVAQEASCAVKAEEQLRVEAHIRPCLRVSGGSRPPQTQAFRFAQQRLQPQVQLIQLLGVVVGNCHDWARLRQAYGSALFNTAQLLAGFVKGRITRKSLKARCAFVVESTTYRDR
jgi:hypothetical protein